MKNAAYVCGLLLLAGAAAADTQGPVDLTRLRRGGDDWEILTEEVASARGVVRLRQDKWLMYFLHWRPLTEERRSLSVESVRKLLLSFWGPDMPFTLSGAQGTMSVAGHPAFYVEGVFKGVVRTASSSGTARRRGGSSSATRTSTSRWGPPPTSSTCSGRSP